MALQRCFLTPLTILLLIKTLEKDRYGSSKPMTTSRAEFLTSLLYTCNVAAIFFQYHPYIWSTTVLHNTDMHAFCHVHLPRIFALPIVHLRRIQVVGSLCGCIRNSVYVGLCNDVMAPRRANGGACRCQVLEQTWSPWKVSTDAVTAVFEE